MEKDAVLFGNCTDLFDWLNTTILIYIKICDLRSALFLKIFAGVKDCMMLDLGCDDVVSFGFICFKGGFQCPVIRL